MMTKSQAHKYGSQSAYPVIVTGFRHKHVHVFSHAVDLYISLGVEKHQRSRLPQELPTEEELIHSFVSVKYDLHSAYG